MSNPGSWEWSAEIARPRTATNSADVARSARLQQIVGHQPRLSERQQVPTGKHVGLDTETVTSDSTCRPAGKKRSSRPARTRIPIGGHASKSHTELADGHPLADERRGEASAHPTADRRDFARASRKRGPHRSWPIQTCHPRGSVKWRRGHRLQAEAYDNVVTHTLAAATGAAVIREMVKEDAHG
jgi:hypothetical protein